MGEMYGISTGAGGNEVSVAWGKIMGTQAPTASLHAFIETQIDLEIVGHGPVVQISLPSSRASRPQRRVVSTTTGSAAFKNEEAYSRSCLATASSIYFSKLQSYPQSFLWRILENSRVLELRSADLRKNVNNRVDATVVLQLGFPSAIRKGGVAFADDEADTLNVFILTKGNDDLVTLTVPNKSFYDVAALNENTSEWCKSFRPAPFNLSPPHRLIAGSPRQLVVALADGKLLNLTRGAGQDASTWQELFCEDGKWGSSLRGLINWQGNNTVRHDGTVLDQNAAIAMSFSPSRTHLLTVCANHTFKIWNRAKGIKLFTSDLLHQSREPQDLPRVMLDAGSSELLRVFEAEGAIAGDDYYAITYTPHDGGHFKIWAIRDADHGKSGVRVLHPDDILRPPDPDSSPEGKAIWKMADFNIGVGEAQGSDVELWVLMRSNKRYKTYNLKCNLLDLPTAWSDQWTVVATEMLGQQLPPSLFPSDPRDPSEVWLGYMLYPGRYTHSILETALSMYCSARKLSKANDPSAALEDRLCSAIVAQVTSQPVKHDTEAGPHFAEYREAMQQEWSLFHQEVQDLDRLRWQVLTLAVDDRFTMPCSISAGGCAVLRRCSNLESMARNTPAVLQHSRDLLEAPSIEDNSRQMPQLPYELSILIQGAATFTATFNATFEHSCQTWLSSELWQEPLFSVADRISKYYEHCAFAEEVTDSAIDNLRDSLAPLGSFEALTTDHFLAIVEKLPRLMETEKSSLVSSIFGLKILVKGAQEMINLYERILFNLLMVLVFLEVESPEEVVSESNLNTSTVFMALIEQLKQYDVMQWLAKSVWTGQQGSRTVSGERTFSNTQTEGLTILESLFAADIRPQSLDRQPQSVSLTDSIQDLLVWVTGGNSVSMTLEQVLVNIQGNLLKENDTASASDFLRFQPSTAWAMYIRGRLHLVLGETADAALCFQKAAYQIYEPQTLDQDSGGEDDLVALHYHQASAKYLSMNEARHFGKGLPKYYTHILVLFQTACFPSYAAQFAQLAIQFTHQSSSEQLKSLLISTFKSSLQTSDTQTAYTALMRLPHEEQSKVLPDLVKALLKLPNGPSQLLELPWPAQLHPIIDKYLTNEKQFPHVLTPGTTTPAVRDQRKILAAWRLHHDDFRGAAAALYFQLHQQTLQTQKGKQKAGTLPRFRIEGSSDGTEKGDRAVDEGYLTVINLMACISNGALERANTCNDGRDDDAWLLSAANGGKRKVVRIEDVRKGWQKELDRRSVVEGGRWGFGMDDDEMDVG
ncbi:MAG: hypothetical protein Q9182_006397 [Xanthomendoza sp. 2 TL-2023]